MRTGALILAAAAVVAAVLIPHQWDDDPLSQARRCNVAEMLALRSAGDALFAELSAIEDDPQRYEDVQRRAEAGETPAMEVLAVYHWTSPIEDEPLNEGIDWMVRAAEAGSPFAMNELGYELARTNQGRKADPAAARAWLERAMAAGEPLAGYNLGRLYESGALGPDTEDGRTASQAALDAYLHSAARCYYGGLEAVAARMWYGDGLPADRYAALRMLRLVDAYGQAIASQDGDGRS
ncbi:MAG: sel1 repeat family protein [Maricaulaceae bacterium]|nr:sel1 repeat family protein [Maricaulaceae bacterium]